MTVKLNDGGDDVGRKISRRHLRSSQRLVGDAFATASIFHSACTCYGTKLIYGTSLTALTITRTMWVATNVVELWAHLLISGCNGWRLVVLYVLDVSLLVACVLSVRRSQEKRLLANVYPSRLNVIADFAQLGLQHSPRWVVDIISPRLCWRSFRDSQVLELCKASKIVWCCFRYIHNNLDRDEIDDVSEDHLRLHFSNVTSILPGLLRFQLHADQFIDTSFYLDLHDISNDCAKC